MKKVLFVSNSSWYIYNFRLNLIKDLQSKGFTIKIICPKDDLSKKLIKHKIEVINWRLSRQSINPLTEIISVINLFLIYKKEKPYFVHHFTIKPCIYGTIAAKFTEVSRVFNAITGLGHVFLGSKKRNSLLRFLINPLYKFVFLEEKSKLIFQNNYDKEEFIKLGFAKLKNSITIRGSGVDIDFFKPTKDNAGIYKSPIRILFPSRIIKEKGLCETILACKIVLEQGYKIELLIAGKIDIGNRSSFTKKEIQLFSQYKFTTFLGHINNMQELYLNSDIVILPSWREGLSKTLIEAASMERPIIATNVPGCKDVVEHGVNGLLVPKKNIEALALAIKFMIINPNLAKKFGKNSRLKVISEFELTKINNETIKEYEVCIN